MKLAVLALVISLPAVALADSPGACPPLPGFPSCATTPGAWLYARNPAALEGATGDAREAARAFQRSFGVAPRRGAVVFALEVDAATRTRLREHGAEFVLPMPSAAELEASEVSDQKVSLEVLAAVEAKLGRKATPAERASLQAQLAGEDPSQKENLASLHGALGHELGHLWFMRAFSPEAPMPGVAPSTDGHYGGPLPDYLDETAAILCENAALTAQRRAAFRVRLAAGQVTPLEKLTTMEHPGLSGPLQREIEKAKREINGGQSPSQAIVLKVDGAGAFAEAAGFYADCRGLADLLVGRTHDAQIFAEIARAAARGQGFAAWLSRRGKTLGLPARLEDLQALLLAPGK